MSQNKRLLYGLLILLGMGGLMLLIDALRSAAPINISNNQVVLSAGDVPIYLDGTLTAGIKFKDLEKMKIVSFYDTEENKKQEGWLVYEILTLYLPEEVLSAGTRVRISSSSRVKSIELTWLEISDKQNWVLFALSGRQTLKLVSKMPILATREQWIQDTDRVEVINP